MLQDVGSSFGPRKVDLEKWEQFSVWSDRASCAVTMEGLPYNGATFKPTKISEAGRQHLASLLKQLSDQQISALFSSARFDQAKGMIGFTASPVSEWTRVFKKKVQRSGLLKDLRRKRHYLKPSEARQLKAKAARQNRRKGRASS